MAGVLTYLKSQNKVQLGSYITENAKIRYSQCTDGVLYCWKCKNKVGLGFNLFKMLKLVLTGI